MYTKTSPLHSRILERRLLTGIASSKKTYHITLSTMGSAFPYTVGDSVGVIPQNDPNEVQDILSVIGASGNERVYDKRAEDTVSFKTLLDTRVNLYKVTKAMVGRGTEQKQSLYEQCEHHPLTPQEIADTALPLLPRFYSIANSSRMHPDELHLLVAYVSYEINGRKRRGVSSHYLCEIAALEIDKVPIYLLPSSHFSLPQDPTTSIILIGPGTGVAPFRAFLQERLATQATGRNWLFFGERNRTSDFYYSEFWLDLEKQGRLRLDLAFSRDTEEKVYVQHKMYEERKSLWGWLQEGAYIYICGSASTMGPDVIAMLYQITREEGHMNEEEARRYVKELQKQKRLAQDLY